MATAPLDTVVRHLRRVVAAPGMPPPSDAELLERFVRQRDGVAFEVLVWRHQRLVFGVCRRVLRDLHDAEDAFQATFLALARKAGTISKRQALAGWLYQVAYRIACRAHAGIARRSRREQPTADLTTAQQESNAADEVHADLLPLLDREVQQLPAKYREPLVLCYLEGKTYDEAARQLGWPKGTLSTRLTRARDLLRAKLTRRGLALSAAALATALCEQAAFAAAPATLVAATVQTILPSGGPSAKVAALTEGVLQAMFWSKMKIALGVTLTLALLIIGGALLVPHLTPTAQAQTPNPLGGASGEAVQPDPAPIWQLRYTLKAPEEVTALAISADGKRIAGGGGKVRLWDVATGAELLTADVAMQRLGVLRFSADNRTLVLGGVPQGQQGGVMFLDLETGKVLSRFQDEAAPLVLFLSMEGRHAAVVNTAGKLQLLDVPTGKQIKSLKLMEGPHDAAAAAPKVIAFPKIGGDGVILVDTNTGNVTRQLAGFTGDVGTIAFSRDGKRLAVTVGKAKKSDMVYVYDTDTGRILYRINADKQPLHGLAISPDGKFLAAAGEDRAIRLWDADSGKAITALVGHESAVIVVIFSPDGRKLISGGADGTVRIWELGKADAAVGKVPQPAVVGDRLAELVKALVKAQKTDAQIIEALFLATMARLPHDAEVQLIINHIAGKKDRVEVYTDVVWAMTNSIEFHANVEALRMRDPRREKK